MYLRRGDYENAYGAYEAAAEKYSDAVDVLGVDLCNKNMAGIKRKQENPDTVVGFHRHAIDIDQTLFYPPVQLFTSEPPVSHSS